MHCVELSLMTCGERQHLEVFGGGVADGHTDMWPSLLRVNWTPGFKLLRATL